MAAHTAFRFGGFMNAVVNTDKCIALGDRSERWPEITQQSIMHAVDPAIKLEFLTTSPSILDSGNRGDAANLHLYIEFAHPIDTGVMISNSVESRTMFSIKHHDWL